MLELKHSLKHIFTDKCKITASRCISHDKSIGLIKILPTGSVQVEQKLLDQQLPLVFMSVNCNVGTHLQRHQEVAGCSQNREENTKWFHLCRNTVPRKLSGICMV